MAKLRNVYIPFTLINSSSIFISWELPSLVINPIGEKPTIKNFKVFYRAIRTVNTTTKSANSNQFNITISDLKPDTEYEVNVEVNYEDPPYFSGENVTFPSIRTRPQSKFKVQRNFK